MPGIGQGDAAMDLAADDLIGVGGEQRRGRPQLHLEAQVVAPIAVQPRPRSPISHRSRSGVKAIVPNPACGGTRSSHTVCQMPVVRGYQMECGSSCQSCLPRGFARSSGSSSARMTISHARPSQAIGDVEAEWRVAALVPTDRYAVDPDGGREIDGAAVEDPPFPSGGRIQFAPTAIPARAQEVRAANAARRRFGSERHHDFARPRHVGRLLPSTLIIKRELPDAVQGEPGAASELGPRVSMPAVVQGI